MRTSQKMPIQFTERVGEVDLESDDGAYLLQSLDGRLLWQIIVVGQMQGSPGAYVAALGDKLGRALRIRGLDFLQATTDDLAAEVMERGFVSIVAEPANQDGAT